MQKKMQMVLPCLFSFLLIFTVAMAENEQFKDLGNGTIIDNETGYIWQKGYGGGKEGIKWEDAANYCKNLSLANKKWRLPEIDELKTLVIKNKNSYGWCISGLFLKSAGLGYWSSTALKDTDKAWYIYFYDGYFFYFYKTKTYYTKCIYRDIWSDLLRGVYIQNKTMP